MRDAAASKIQIATSNMIQSLKDKASTKQLSNNTAHLEVDELIDTFIEQLRGLEQDKLCQKKKQLPADKELSIVSCLWLSQVIKAMLCKHASKRPLCR